MKISDFSLVGSKVGFIYGEAATGKTTLCCNIAALESNKGKKVLYCLFDNSLASIKERLKYYACNPNNISFVKYDDYSGTRSTLIEKINTIEGYDVIIVDDDSCEVYRKKYAVYCNSAELWATCLVEHNYPIIMLREQLKTYENKCIITTRNGYEVVNDGCNPKPKETSFIVINL